MKCIILAAGYATRLYPLTENFPKPLLEVKDKTILDWLIEDIERSSFVDEYVVISNHRFYHHFVEWAGKKDLNITVLDDKTETNETRLGAVCDVQYALDVLNIRSDALVIAGDNLLDFSLTKFISYAKSKNASCIMRYYEPSHEKLLKCGVVTVDDNDKVLNMTEKSPEPATNWCCPPFYYYTSGDLSMIRTALSEGCGKDAPGSFAAWLCHRSDLYAMEMPGRRYDIGTLESYENVQRIYKGYEND